MAFNFVSSFVQWFRIVAFHAASAYERDRPGFDPRMGSISFCWLNLLASISVQAMVGWMCPLVSFFCLQKQAS